METLLDLAEPWAYIAIALLSAAESGAMVGLFLPGETIMLLGGVLVFQGNAEAVPMVLSAWVGGMCGDAFSFYLGRRYGDRLKATRLGRRIGEERWDRASSYLNRFGGKAVFFGRFVGVFRALLPPLAGASKMHPSTFFKAIIPAGLLFGGGFVLLGVAAGGSWHLIDQWAGHASLIAVVVVAVVAISVVGVRWVGHHRERLLQAARHLPWVRRFTERYGQKIHSLWLRWGVRGYGLYLLLAAGAIVAGSVIFGQIIDAVMEENRPGPIDSGIMRFFVDNRAPEMTSVMKVVFAVGSWQVVVPLLALVATITYARLRELRLVAFIVTAGSAIILAELVRVAVARPNPLVVPLVDPASSSFPNPQATAITMLCVTIAFLLSRDREWGISVAIWGATAPVALIVGIAALYLGVAWPSDVVGGWLLGGVWTVIAYTAIDLPRHRHAWASSKAG